MWWRAIFGKYRYKWLVAKKEISLTANVGIDEIYVQVFSSIDLSKDHTAEDYGHLIRALSLRVSTNASNYGITDNLIASNSRGNQVFPLELICLAADNLSVDLPSQAWEIIYRMIKLGSISKGSNSTLIYAVLQKLEDTIDPDERFIDGILSALFKLGNREDSFRYSCYLWNTLRTSLDSRPYPSANMYPSVRFSDDMKSNIITALDGIRISEMRRS